MSDDDHETEQRTITARVDGPGVEDIMAALQEYQRKVTESAFKAGFKAGWDEATSAVQRAFANASLRPKMPRLSEEPKVEATHVAKPKNSSEAVFNVISDAPGSRGVEIVRILADRGTPLLERTVRTVLWRLKNASRIKVVDGRWYTPESAPSEPPSQEEEADNAAAR